MNRVKSSSTVERCIEDLRTWCGSEDHASYATIVQLRSYGLFNILDIKRSISTSVRPFHNLEWRCEER